MSQMKPILFNTEMVKAILDGRKTVTRRIADINTEITCNDGTANHDFVLDNFVGETPTGFVCRKCGFGIAPPHSRVPCGTSLFRPRYWPGDVLYVRETWYSAYDGEKFFFLADKHTEREEKTLLDYDDERWRPSIHMPKEAARIFLRVNNVKVEQLQSISADDCAMEGVPLFSGLVGERDNYYRYAFAKLWDSTTKPASLPTCGWDANPWVWAYKFERIGKEEVASCP